MLLVNKCITKSNLRYGTFYGTEEVFKNGLAHQLLLFTFKVSWIRQRDSHILTVDRMTFISDDRFQILSGEKKNAWTLRIRYSN